MKLFLISQTINDDYNTYDSAVVCAAGITEAVNIHPNGEKLTSYKKECLWLSGWCSSPAEVSAKYLGEAVEGIEKGVICASYNAG